MNTPNRSRILIPALVILIGGGLFAFRDSLFAGDAVQRDPGDIFRARRGDLKVTITEAATLEAAKSVVVRSDVEGRPTILWLIPEGSRVRKGARLCELDVTTIKDREETQAISVSRAKSGFVTAEKNLEIQRNQNKSDIEAAEIQLAFAKMDVEKFTGVEGTATSEKQMGEREQRIIQFETDVNLKKELLEQAKLKYDWTQKLHAKKYVSDRDLDTDRIAVISAENNLIVAKNKLDILMRYDLLMDERNLASKVKEADANLERTKLRCQARLAQEMAELETNREAYQLEVAKLEKYRDQIKAAVIMAPSDGLVVYANVGDRRRQTPIDEGTEVRQGQAIVILPDTSTMVAKTAIHESQIGLLEKNSGYEAVIKVDALPDTVFTGRVSRVGQTADSNRSWFNPEIKLYKCEVSIDGDTSVLKPNQTASVEIIADQLTDVVTIPIQAVQRARRVLYVWRDDGSAIVPVAVERGISNEKFVVITKGLNEGDAIYLHEPEGVIVPLFEELNKQIDAAVEKDDKARIEKRDDHRKKGAAAQAAMNGGKGGKSAMAASGKGPGNKGGRPGSSPGGNRSQGGSQGGQSAMMAKWTAFFTEAKAELPEFADQMGDRSAMFGLMRNADFKAKVEAHPVLGPKWKALRGNRSGRSRGGNGNRGGSRQQGGGRPSSKGGAG
jgi:HlyD family secretion protein